MRFITQSNPDIDLYKGALLVSKLEYPSLKISEELNYLDDLASTAATRISDSIESKDPLYQMNALSEYLFDELGFKGNHEDYDNPLNSYLSDVMKRRLGIPITLAVVYSEVGRKVGIPILNIGMPGHFLARHAEEPELFVDVFNCGVLLSVEECKKRFVKVTHGSLDWDPNYLNPINNKQVMARILRNLKISYIRNQNNYKALTIIELLLLIEPNAAEEIRDRGLLHFYTGLYPEALNDLRQYTESVTTGADNLAISELIARITRHVEG